jgi:hypothetical protein
MSAIIIMLAGWLMARRPAQSIDVVLAHILWLRSEHPGIGPQTAAALIGGKADSWPRVIELYAEAWERVPEDVRRAGNN